MKRVQLKSALDSCPHSSQVAQTVVEQRMDISYPIIVAIFLAQGLLVAEPLCMVIAWHAVRPACGKVS